MTKPQYQAKPKALVVVSHDVDFLDNVCTDMVHIDNMKLNYYRGNYQRYVKGELLHSRLDRCQVHTSCLSVFCPAKGLHGIPISVRLAPN